MSSLLLLVGILQILGGILVWAIAKSAVHEILGSISFGFGILCVPLAMLMKYVADIRDIAREAARTKGESRSVHMSDAPARPQIPLDDPSALARRR